MKSTPMKLCSSLFIFPTVSFVTLPGNPTYSRKLLSWCASLSVNDSVHGKQFCYFCVIGAVERCRVLGGSVRVGCEKGSCHPSTFIFVSLRFSFFRAS